MSGMYYEQQQPGRRYTTAGRTIDRFEISAFAGLTGDYNPMHTDAQYAAASPFGRIIGHGALGFSIAVGLLNRTGMMDETALAFLGVEDWRFGAPIFAGDTVRVHGEVVAARPSSSQPAGIVSHRLELVNQDDAIVQVGTLNFLIKLSPSDA